MAWAASRGTLDPPAWWLFGATICWAIAYDTIYALQDREDDRRIGVKFGKLLEVLPDILNMDAGTLPGHLERAPRIAANLSAKITLSNASASGKIRNVSKSGMMIETDMPLNADKQLLVSLSDGKILTASVKWVEGDRVGIRLSSPVSILQFSYGGLM